MIDYERYQVNGEYPFWVEHFKKSEKYLQAALEYDYTRDLQDVADAIADESMQLWPSENAAMVTEVQNYPKCRVLHVYLAGGDMQEIIALIPHIERFAQDVGCQKMTLAGRKGWERIFKHWTNIKPICVWLMMEV
jgi:hypothetical protein